MEVKDNKFIIPTKAPGKEEPKSETSGEDLGIPEPENPKTGDN